MYVPIRPYCSGISYFFFFSSRRRHTRFKCDWSSDVCSSDLQGRAVVDHASDLACAAVVDAGVRLGHGHLAKAVLAQCAQAWLGRARDVTQELPGSATAANPEMAACAGRADGNAPAVDEVGVREARAVASMAGEQGDRKSVV